MIIYPKIENFINILRDNKFSTRDDIDNNALNILRENGSTATEAMITLHLGFNFSDIGAENFVNESSLWQREDIQDVAYQTFLYMNYNPDDPDFSYDENKVRFPLISQKKSKSSE